MTVLAAEAEALLIRAAEALGERGAARTAPGSDRPWQLRGSHWLRTTAERHSHRDYGRCPFCRDSSPLGDDGVVPSCPDVMNAVPFAEAVLAQRP